MNQPFEFANPLKTTLIDLLEKRIDSMIQDKTPAQTTLALLWPHLCNSMLAYTAHPYSKATQKCIALAVDAFYQQDLQNPNPESPIQSSLMMLMPSLCDFEHTSDPDKDLCARWDNTRQKWLDIADPQRIHTRLQNILASHILGREGKCLIPVLESLEQTVAQPFYPYFISDADRLSKANTELLPSELERVYTHSHLTRKLYDAKVFLQALYQKTEQLLGQLNLLLQAFRQASILHLGQEEQAEQNVYPVILGFFAFYDALSSSMQESIPADTKAWVAGFREIQAGKNSDIMRICLNQQVKMLARCLEKDAVTLAKIGLPEAEQAKMIELAQAHMLEAKTGLRQGYQSGLAQGVDVLPITKKMLSLFSEKPQDWIPASTTSLSRLDKNSIKALTTNKAVLEILLDHFKHANHLLSFAHHTSEAALEAILEILVEHGIAADSSLVREEQLRWCVNTMQPAQSALLAAYILNSNAKKRFNAIEQFLKPRSAPIAWFIERVLVRICGKTNGQHAVANADDFTKLLCTLPSAYHASAIETAKPYCAHWFESTLALRRLFASLSRQADLSNLAHSLPKIMSYVPKAAEQTRHICNWIFAEPFSQENPLSCKPSLALFHACKPQLRTLFQKSTATQTVEDMLQMPFEVAFTAFKAAWANTHPSDSLFHRKPAASYQDMHYEEKPRNGL